MHSEWTPRRHALLFVSPFASYVLGAPLSMSPGEEKNNNCTLDHILRSRRDQIVRRFIQWKENIQWTWGDVGYRIRSQREVAKFLKETKPRKISLKCDCVWELGMIIWSQLNLPAKVNQRWKWSWSWWRPKPRCLERKNYALVGFCICLCYVAWGFQSNLTSISPRRSRQLLDRPPSSSFLSIHILLTRYTSYKLSIKTVTITHLHEI